MSLYLEPEELPGDPESNPDSLDSRLAEAWERIEAAQDDNEWIDAYMAWLELHRLAYGTDLGESETN